jgi:hypothetical protein
LQDIYEIRDQTLLEQDAAKEEFESKTVQVSSSSSFLLPSLEMSNTQVSDVEKCYDQLCLILSWRVEDCEFSLLTGVYISTLLRR